MKQLFLFLCFLCLGVVVFADNPHNVPRGPVIVAESDISATYQNGVTNAFPVYTVPVTGLYRVSSYVEEVPVTNSDLWQIIVLWADDSSNSRSYTQADEANTYSNSTVTVYAVAGSVIQIQVSTANDSSQFRLFSVVEKL